MGQVAAGRERLRREADTLDHRHGPAARPCQRRVGTRRRESLEEPRTLGLGAGHRDRVEHRHRRHQLRRLEAARHAQAGDAVGCQAGHVAPAERHPAAVGPVEPGDQVGEGGLAGAVGADDAQHLAPGEVDVDTGQRPHAAIGLLEPADGQGGTGRHPSGALRRTHGGGNGGSGWRPGAAPQALGGADQTVGHEDDRRQQRRAIGDKVGTLEPAHPLRQMHKQQRPEDGAGDAGAAADHGHGQAGDHDREARRLRGDHAQGMDVKRPGPAGVESAQHEHGHAHAPHVEPEGARRQGRLAHEQEPLAVEAAHGGPGGEPGEGDPAPDEGGQRPTAAEGETEQLDARHPRQAVGAAGHRLPVDGEEQHPLAHRQGRQREVVGLEPEHRRGDDRRQGRRRQQGEGKGGREAPAVAAAENAGHIGAEAEEGALDQAQGPGMAEDELVAQHHQCIDAGDGEQAQAIGRGDEEAVGRQRCRRQCQDGAGAAREPGLHPAQARRLAASPSRPWGRSSRIAIRPTYRRPSATG